MRCADSDVVWCGVRLTALSSSIIYAGHGQCTYGAYILGLPAVLLGVELTDDDARPISNDHQS